MLCERAKGIWSFSLFIFSVSDMHLRYGNIVIADRCIFFISVLVAFGAFYVHLRYCHVVKRLNRNYVFFFLLCF